MMKRFVVMVLLILSLSFVRVMAQSDEVVCMTPFLTQAQFETMNASLEEGENLLESLMVIDDAITTDRLFVQRILFENAYNVIKYNIRLAQLQTSASETGRALDELLASDAQIQQIQQERMFPDLLAQRVLSELAEDSVVWAYAEANNIAISADDYVASQAEFFDFTEDMTNEARIDIINSFYEQVSNHGADDAEIDAFFCRQAVYDRVQDAVFGGSNTAIFVNADHILVSSELVAQDIINLLGEGEPFEELAMTLSLDTATSADGGALGWQAAALYVDAFADAVLDAEIGVIANPVETQFGWHVIRVNGREERELSSEQGETIVNAQFSRWRTDALEAASVSIDEAWLDFVPTLPTGELGDG